MKLTQPITKMFRWILFFLMIMMGSSMIGQAAAISETVQFIDNHHVNRNPILNKPHQLLLISSDIDNLRTDDDESVLLGQASSDRTIAVVYDAKSATLDTILQIIERAATENGITSFENIAFATHGQQNGFCITRENCVSQNTLYQPLLNEFWSNLSQYTRKRIDLTGCFLGKNEALLSRLSQQTHRTITASTNITGSPEKNGDWFLEVGNIDLGKTYFDARPLNEIKTISLAAGDFSANTVYEGQLNVSGGTLEGTPATFTETTNAISGDGLWRIESLLPGIVDNYKYIKTNAVIDYETYAPTNGGNKTYTITVNDADYPITLTVLNVLEVSNQSMGVTENAINGDVVGVINVSQYDIEDFSPTFAITGGNTNNVFALANASGGTIIVNDATKLDYETISNYNLTFSVTAGATVETANISIDITNVNDSPNVADQNFNIDENSNVGTTVGTVLVSKSYTYTLGYAITGGNTNTAFSISSGGIIKVNNKSALNYEAAQTYTLVVTVSGGEYDPTATVIVDVNDVNESPVMNNQSFSIAENTASGTFAYTVLASDPESDPLTYSITGGNTGSAFAISETTGALWVVGNLNYESLGTYDLVLAVMDGEFTKTATISVTLTDENDPPSLNNQTMSVNENSPNNTQIGSALSATDPDVGDVTLTYSIIGGSGINALKISTGGQISVKSSTLLNYEGSTTSYTVIVQVADPGGLTDTAQVTVNINNVNESPTIIAQATSITENTANGTIVYTVLASDPDNTYSPYTDNVFSITGGSGSTGFTISSAGIIYVSNSTLLNYETVQTLLLTVRVEDSSDSGLAASETVSIALTNINDNTPVITSQTYSVGKYSINGVKAAPDNVPLATDADGDSLTYNINSGNTNGALTITNGYFVIANASQFQTDSTPSYFISISVTDGTRTATKTVRVNVENYPPSISPVSDDTSTVNTAQTLTLSVNDSNGDSLTIVAFSSDVTLIPNDDTHIIVGGNGTLYTLSVENSTELIPLTYLPLNLTGTAVIYLTVTDASSATGTENFNIVITENVAPQIGTVSGRTFDLATITQNFNFTVADSRNEQLTVTVGSSDTSVLDISNNTTSISNEGDTYSFNIGETSRSVSLKLTPTTVGSVTVTLTLTDQGGLTDSTSFNIIIISAPEMGAISGTTTFDEDAGAQSLNFTVVDADGDPLTITYVSDNTSLFANESIRFSGTNVNSTTNVISSASTELWITLTVTPTTEASGTGSITITVTDASLKTARQTVTFTVNTINDPPTISIPSSLNTNEETELVLSSGNAISISDVDAAANAVQMTLTSSGGILTLSTTTGLTINSGSDGSLFIKFSGTVSEINTALDGLAFSPTTDFSGTASITITVNDLGSTGSDGAKADSEVLTITVNGVNDAPSISAPTTQTTDEDTAVEFSSASSNGFTIVDVDASTDAIQITLNVTNGVISLGQTTGINIHTGSNNSSSMEFTGTVANINAAFEGLSFTPTMNFFGEAVLTVEVDDLGYNGSGVSLSDSTSTTITVNSINDSPIVGAISDQTTNQGSITNAISFTITDAEAGILTVTCASSNALLVSSGSFDLSGTGSSSYTTTISASETQSLSMTIMPSAMETGTVSITVVVTDASGVTATSLFDLTVYDIPTINWASASQTVTETTTILSIPINLSTASGQPVNISYTITGSASSGVDYTYTSTNFTIPAGDQDYTISINLIDNNTFEGDETIILSIVSVGNAVAGDITVHTITIDDDSDQPTVSWVPDSYTVLESAGSIDLTIMLNTASEVNTVIGYSVTAGTATGGGVDYTLSDGTVTIIAGSTSAKITCAIEDDTIDEYNETVMVSIQSYSNGVAGSSTEYTLTIEDNDNAPTIAWSSADYSVTENAGLLLITATISNASARDISFGYTVGSGTATNGVDYTLVDGELTISAGFQSITISIEINDDSFFEEDETVMVTITDVTNTTAGGILQTTITILDNESEPTISWNPSNASISESAGTIQITATLSSVSGLSAIIDYTVSGTAANGSDYTLSDGTLIISAGSQTANLTITLGDDSIDENDETVYVQMTAYTNTAAGSATQFTLTITDDDDVPSISFSPYSYSVTEDAGIVTITATVSVASGKTISADYAVSG
ncbi:MAG: cadherin domain-containing protein, partial [Candidatus Magnetomorum sp.]|nr:cadherin domain-containing protein [Candidatus Magnetomorum sp.]